VVRQAGYFLASQSLDVPGATQTSVTFRRGTVTLEINVTDDHFESPQPVGGASVDIAGSGSVVTQPTGIGRISVPVNAYARITVTKDGYRTTEVSEFIAEDDERIELSIQRVPAISVELLSSRVVTGESVSLSVTDEYGDPVEGATVSMDGDEVAETDASGQAVIRVESEGNHTVTVRAEALEATAYVEGITEAEAGDGGGTEVDGSDQDGAETTAPFGQPGFGPGVAVLALVGAVAVGLARRRGLP
jgi:nitrate reductase NapAB chaperone NapD